MDAHNGFKIVKDKFNNFIIKYDGKGSVPVELRGAYTHEGLAKQAIAQYEAKKVNKGGKKE